MQQGIVTPPRPPSPPPPSSGFSVAAGGALRGAGKRASQRAGRVPGAGEHAALVRPPATDPLPRGPARAHALHRRGGHSGRRGLHGAAAANLIGGAVSGEAGFVLDHPGSGRARVGQAQRAAETERGFAEEEEEERRRDGEEEEGITQIGRAHV